MTRQIYDNYLYIFCICNSSFIVIYYIDHEYWDFEIQESLFVHASVLFFLQFILQHTKTTYFSAQKLFVNGKQSKTVLNLLCQKWKQKMEYIMVCSNTGDTGAKSTEI